MAEHLRHAGEHKEQLDLSNEYEQNLRRHAEAAKNAEHDPLAHSLDALRAKIEQQAISGKEHESRSSEQSSASQPLGLHRELKADAYRRTLQKARTQLSAPDRVFSRIIHQPTIEAISMATAQTVARPSGLFTGSLFALLGSGFLLYITKRYGFSYNYAVFLLCFAGGFAVGIIIELLWRLLFRRRSL